MAEKFLQIMTFLMRIVTWILEMKMEILLKVKLYREKLIHLNTEQPMRPFE